MPPDRKTLFLEGPIGTALIRLAIPIILGNLLQTGYQLTDAFWSGGWAPPRWRQYPSAFPSPSW
jgi:Na+-driven multidrug efflux pump